MDFGIVIITSLFFGIVIFFNRDSTGINPLIAWIAITGGMLFFWVMSNFKTDKDIDDITDRYKSEIDVLKKEKLLQKREIEYLKKNKNTKK
tara:strand:- start:166 stop:438 length:273 start_codon:yes stop_codon:yes gene_type:complete